MRAIGLILVCLTTAAPARAQTASAAHPVAVIRDTSAGVQPPAGYVIGPDDELAIVFLYDKDLSSDVAVRPDGMISLPLVNDIQAAGLTPDQLRVNVITAMDRFIEEPTVSVVVKRINSRKVFITGKVNKPGVYPLHESTTVLQLIATAGGLLEYADSKNIVIMRKENGTLTSRVYNHNEIVKGKNLLQNIELKSGDTIIVP